MEFKSKEAEAAAKGFAESKAKFQELRSIGAYQSAAVSLGMAYPEDRAAIFEAFGMSEREQVKAPIRTPVRAVGRSAASLAAKPKSTANCPTCGKKKSQPVIQNPVSAVSRTAAGRVLNIDKQAQEIAETVTPEDLDLKNKIDELVGDMNLENETIKTSGDILLDLLTPKPAKTREDAEKELQPISQALGVGEDEQSALIDLLENQNYALTKPMPIDGIVPGNKEQEEGLKKAKNIIDAAFVAVAPKQKRPRKPRTPKTEKE